MVLDWCEMAGDLRTWDDDCVDELCDIVFGEFLLGNFVQGVPHDLVWDVITQTLNSRIGKDFCEVSCEPVPSSPKVVLWSKGSS